MCFIFKGIKAAKYCSKHAEESITVNVVSRRCLHEDCAKGPSFNFEGRKPAAYCAQHADNGMVHILVKKCCSMAAGRFGI